MPKYDVRQGQLQAGQTVVVYRNLHNGLLSVKLDGIGSPVHAHVERVVLEGVSFHVQPGGRARALAEGRKNVHAYVRGRVAALALEEGTPIRYSTKPGSADGFVGPDGRPAQRAAAALVDHQRGILAVQP